MTDFDRQIIKVITDEIKELKGLIAVFEIPEEERLNRIKMLEHDLNALIG